MTHNKMANGAPVLIIGGGIAGPAAAIALARAGIESVVHEASVAPRDEAGAFFNLAPNGIAVLDALGIGDMLEGLGFRNDRLAFANERGRQLAEVQVGGVTLMRGDLCRTIRERAARMGVVFRFGKSLESIDERADGVEARFSDGSIARGRCVIGADGLHSRTRATVVPNGPIPAYTGVINLGGTVQTALAPTGPTMRMIFGSRAFFGYAVRPSGETYWFSNYAQKEPPADGRAMSVDAARLRQELLALHRDDPPEVRAVLEAVVGDIRAYPVYDLPPLRTWHRGSVCLIGDAAHAIGPHVGQGVAMALEDAFVLARCLRDARNLAEAFMAFEAERRPRVGPVVTQSRRTGKQKAPPGPLGRMMRDLMLPVFLRQSAAGAQRLYQYRPVWGP